MCIFHSSNKDLISHFHEFPNTTNFFLDTEVKNCANKEIKLGNTG